MKLLHRSILTATMAIVGSALPSRAVTAQKLADLSVGARVRISADRATDTGIEHFRKAGALIGADSGHLIIRADAARPDAPDTVALFGVRRLEVFRGRRSRREMITTGAAVGGTAGVLTWLIGRHMIGSAKTVTTVDANLNQSTGRSNVEIARLAIPLFLVGGGLIGALIGPEHWERIPVPSSVFPEAR